MTHEMTRRAALKCLGYGTGTLFALSGGVLTATSLAEAANDKTAAKLSKPLFIQISDTHIGFAKEANPDVAGTLNKTIDLINALPHQPEFLIHTGDITHLSKPQEFDDAQKLFARLKTSELHVVPGEHDITDGVGADYFARFGKVSDNKGYYAFDHQGVHFVALVNVRNFKAGGLGTLGEEQMAWLKNDLAGRAASQPIVLFAHMPLWTVYEPWGWGTSESEEILALIRRFGAVTVLNGHIHQIVQKIEGHITFHTARSTAYPQPQAGVGPGPGPLKLASDQLPGALGLTSVSLAPSHKKLSLADRTLG